MDQEEKNTTRDIRYKYLLLPIESIIPQQHYLSKEKLDKAKIYIDNNQDYGKIYVIEYKNKIFSVDGHHRLFYLYQQGIRVVKVICEVNDNNNVLYQRLADESIRIGFHSIKDLENRILASDKEYEMIWIDKCQMLLLSEDEKVKYINNPCRYSALPLYKELRYNKDDILVIHDTNYSVSLLNQYHAHQVFFRLYHSMKNIAKINIAGYKIKICHIEEDLESIQKIINLSYVHIRISLDEIIWMTKDRVYDSSLWMFIIDEITNQKIALGIGHYDQTVREVILDWIQVLPEFRNHGLGKMLVTNMLYNSPKDALFATVSGECNNQQVPESLYRSCGFTGTDIWHILK